MAGGAELALGRHGGAAAPVKFSNNYSDPPLKIWSIIGRVRYPKVLIQGRLTRPSLWVGGANFLTTEDGLRKYRACSAP